MKESYNPTKLKKIIDRQMELQSEIEMLIAKGSPIAHSWWPWHIIKFERIVKKLAIARVEYGKVCKATKDQLNQQSHYMRQKGKNKGKNNLKAVQ